MKKLVLLFIILVFNVSVLASGQSKNLIQGQISFDWLTKSQLERDKNITDISKILFENSVKKYDKKHFKLKFKDYLKDENSKEHYLLVAKGVKKTDIARLAGFYLGNEKLLIAYAIQYNANPKTIYYYDTLGNLRYVDILSDNYPNYPYYSHQYNGDGKLISSIYYTAYDTQYMFKNEKFIGVWFKDTMFNSNAKKILTRTNY